MSKIFDNIGMSFESGLKAILSNLGVKRADFCVGYFNLRGWKLLLAMLMRFREPMSMRRMRRGMP